MSFFTSAITSGPMPSPARRSSLWVAIGIRLFSFSRSSPAAQSAKGRRHAWQAGARSTGISMPSETPHVVIVGAGFGGIEAAKALRRAPVAVTLIDRQNHHCFQPLLYQVATAALSPADIAWPIRHILRGQDNA